MATFFRPYGPEERAAHYSRGENACPISAIDPEVIGSVRYAAHLSVRKEKHMIQETKEVVEIQIEELEAVQAPMIVWGD